MKKLFRTFIVSTLLLVPAVAVQAQVSFGVRIGEPPAPRAYRVPNRPGPDYVWVEGYQYPQGSSYRWHDGYWTQPPYEGAYWVEPYYYSGMYYSGQWEGNRGNFGHNHKWDRNKQRDERRYRNDDRGDRRGNGRDNRRR
jgi:YXWGXW repeat-containing protein